MLILEDTDGDGRCDKTTVFADGLMIPTGLELGDGGAYVGHGTELLFLKDTDGDDKADERRVLLRGFGTGDNHQNINSFLWGPGGELWMSQGLHIRSRVETPWGIVRLEQAGIWRLWPRRLKLEGFYGSEHEPQNPWGFVFTDWGEPIVLAGNNSSTIYPVPGLIVNHRDDPPLADLEKRQRPQSQRRRHRRHRALPRRLAGRAHPRRLHQQRRLGAQDQRRRRGLLPGGLAAAHQIDEPQLSSGGCEIRARRRACTSAIGITRSSAITRPASAIRTATKRTVASGASPRKAARSPSRRNSPARPSESCWNN